METKKVIKNTHIPIYYQLKDIIREKIESGEWVTGDMIPSEPELSRYHQISKMTARQSITELCEEGLLYRVRGKGTFVAKPRIDRDLSTLTYFTEEIKRSGVDIETKLLKSDIVECTNDIAEKLEIDTGEEVIRVQRLREIDGSPFYIETCYFPSDMCAGLLEKDLSQHSLHYLVENYLGYSIDHAIMEIEAVASNGYQSNLLGIKQGGPLLFIQQTTFLQENRPVQFVEAVSRSDKFKYSLMRRKRR